MRAAAQRARLRTIHRTWATGTQSTSLSDRFYSLYLAGMAGLVLGAPVVRWAVLALADPALLPLLQHPALPGIALGSSLLLTAALPALGASRGPALLSPFLTSTLAASDLPRARVLRRPLLRSWTLLAAALALVAAIPTAALLQLGAAPHGALGAALMGALALSGPVLLIWLAGQVLAPTGRRVLMAVLSAAGLTVLLGAERLVTEAPWLPTGATGPLLTALTVLALLISAITAHVLLRRVRGPVLLAQAIQAEAIADQITTGDMGGAAMTAAQRPSVGRHLPLIGGTGWRLYVRRDLLAWLRTPERSLGAVLRLALGAGLVTGAPLLAGPLLWTLHLCGAVLLLSGTSALLDGVRHAVRTAGAPALYEHTTGAQVVRHLGAPLLGSLVIVVAATVSLLLVLPGLAPSRALVTAVLLVALATAIAVRDTAKGPLPLELLTPMPTAQGDLSALARLAWQLDAQLLMALGAAVLLLRDLAPSPLLVLVAAGMVLGHARTARRRLRELR